MTREPDRQRGLDMLRGRYDPKPQPDTSIVSYHVEGKEIGYTGLFHTVWSIETADGIVCHGTSKNVRQAHRDSKRAVRRMRKQRNAVKK